MTTLEAIATIAGAIVLLGGGGVGAFLKHRNGKAKAGQQSQQQPALRLYQPPSPPPPSLVDPAGDTGRHLAMTDTQRNLPTPFGLTAGELRAMAENIQIAAQRAPATAQDVEDAVRPVRAEVEKLRQTTSDAIGGLRIAVAGLPCQAPTATPCPADKTEAA
jgi:hypothetical protein